MNEMLNYYGTAYFNLYIPISQNTHRQKLYNVCVHVSLYAHVGVNKNLRFHQFKFSLLPREFLQQWKVHANHSEVPLAINHKQDGVF